MTRSNRPKTYGTIVDARAGDPWAPAMSGAAQPAAGDPLQLVPAESLFCVRDQQTEYDDGPGGPVPHRHLAPFGVSMLVQSQLAQLLGSPEPERGQHVRRLRRVRAAARRRQPDPSRVGILVPVSDYQKFAKGNPNVTPPDAQGLSASAPRASRCSSPPTSAAMPW